MTDLSVTTSCFEEFGFFQFPITAILWCTPLADAHSLHMSIETARPDASVRTTMAKVQQELTF